MTQKEIAKLLKEHQSTISRILSGERRVSLSFSKKMAGAFPFKTSVEWRSTPLAEIKSALKKHNINLKKTKRG